MLTIALVVIALALLPIALRIAGVAFATIIGGWADLTLAPWRVQAAVAGLGLALFAALCRLGRTLGF